MENAGAITFRDSLLLVDEKNATSEQRIGVASVLALLASRTVSCNVHRC